MPLSPAERIAKLMNSTAIGYDAAANHDESTAIGANSETTRAFQTMIGTVAHTTTIAGLTSTASLAAQGPVTGLVTTDADGNIASDGGALASSVATEIARNDAQQIAINANSNMIAAASGDISGLQTEVTQNSADIANNRVDIDANRADIDANTMAISDISGGFTDLTGRVDDNETAIATEVERNDIQATAIDQNRQGISDNGDAINTNSTDIAIEAERNNMQAVAIDSNRLSIVGNTAAIALEAERNDLQAIAINQNTRGILTNSGRIDKVTRGVAMSLAVPDAFLGSGDQMAVSGGAGTFDGEVGFGASIIMRTSDAWSLSAGTAVASGDYVGKVSVRWSK